MPADTPRTIAVLAFHKIGEPPAGGWQTWNYIPEAIFARFLAQLRDARCRVIDLDAFLAGLEVPDSLPERAVLLTFDDGYRSMLTTAQPILDRFGYPAVAFVPTDHVGGVNAWDHGNEPEEPICDWEQLAELQRRGIAVQSHAVTHRSFAVLDAAAREHEIEASKASLEARLGTTVETLALPYGQTGDDVETLENSMRRAGYRAAFLYEGGTCELPTTTPYRITRVPMGPDTNLGTWLEGVA